MKLTTENTENTEQDTPETDEVRRATDCNTLGYGLMTLHARKLERERDEAREERDVFRDALEYIGACGLSARHLKDYAIEVLPKEGK